MYLLTYLLPLADFAPAPRTRKIEAVDAKLTAMNSWE